MNEQLWAAEQHTPQHMVNRLGELGVQRTKMGRRKLRLFACGCVRMWWNDLNDDRLKEAVEVAEHFADGLVRIEELSATFHRIEWLTSPDQYAPQQFRTLRTARWAISTCEPKAFQTVFNVANHPFGQRKEADVARRVLCDLLRCVFGNPFRKPSFPKAWRTETVMALAAGIYEQRAFDRLPILADALEEAGCDDPAMLTHLRGDGPHCRGCWVLDLALGK
jgi:hypothetical protein